MIMRTGPFYENRPTVGDIWRKGMLHFEILGFHFWQGKELVLVECCGSNVDPGMIGRRTFESMSAFKKSFWYKITQKSGGMHHVRG